MMQFISSRFRVPPSEAVKVLRVHVGGPSVDRVGAEVPFGRGDLSVCPRGVFIGAEVQDLLWFWACSPRASS